MVAVDAGGVDLVEAAEVGHADGRVELQARDLDGGHLALGAPRGRQQQQRGQERPRAVVVLNVLRRFLSLVLINFTDQCHVR